MLDNTIYPFLKGQIYARRIKITDIARELNVSPRTIGNWFSGRTKLTQENAIKIQQKFFEDVELEKLFRKE